MKRWAIVLTTPIVAFGAAVEFVMLVFGYVLLRAHCLVGWHSWVWEPWLRVPFYGTGAWQCVWCHKVKVKPCP